ncbi:tRNA delta(2)-isopentenylpyrophosphate transferase [Peptoanaerobacter stomatis]|uniref:tRNA dimethylallyltransferase n=1 Tax=Peptoanaerobacter stomatis TaxID=796937 RepID=G9WYY9_9FIRM|nr:tRNA (adenosine(37)-N6)-dimethylallyltransferase MiaA [Peptoanaerobacter stomatis]EHL16134.1 tRNA delta(2)-isopentenylpyrophosphate transferase [Peptoanaerobacter stomatis]
MNKIIIICGPTAVGKTATSIKLAQKLNTEIISADSMQIYKSMDIGTAKVTSDEMSGIKHHMIDIAKPNENFSVSDFYNRSSKIIDRLFSEKKIPIIAGGTGLYINSLIYKMDFNKTSFDENIRDKYWKMYYEYGSDYLYELLLNKDKNMAQSIEKNNVKRVIRALEIFENNDAMRVFSKVDEFQDYKTYMYVLKLDRSILYERINKRVDMMIENGLIEEVKTLLKNGTDSDAQSMKAIGYRQIISYLQGEIDENTAIELIKRDSRRYAKRQYTWFRRYDFAKWIDVELKNIDEIAEYIMDDIKK